ncbi:hypothetical protein IC762_20870 [Bradyrhizobium genosp. L]|uniref:hypothetical protein n=1 Tax=Bradyrhizobium genosp. L TaxID=83637 RepID=UPI0018A28646|nr:hypothetical protein [Bradyrhizobium genosp. L]QPF82224.1 hypothetical protein IC762_20870 [Bradyrhizobium genosp. L]
MRLVFFGVICAGLAGIHIYNEFDKRVNFRPIDARISQVKEQCYLEKPDGAESGKTWSSDLMSCEFAVLASRMHPKWQSADVKHKIEVRFAYISPVDGATHESSLQMAAYPDGRQLHAGDIFPVQASRKDANRTRANDWVDIRLGRHAPKHGSI